MAHASMQGRCSSSSNTVSRRWRSTPLLPRCSVRHGQPGGATQGGDSRRSAAVIAAQRQQQPSATSSTSQGKPTRRLILMRHADSENPPNVRDHDRPISNIGKQQAAEIARLLLERGWVPDIVLASNALRTRQTLDEMAQVMDALKLADTHLYGSLYTVAALDGQTRQHIEECLLEVVDDRRTFCVAVVGHNKGMEEAASSFAGETVKLRTASVALLEGAAASWRDVLSPLGSQREAAHPSSSSTPAPAPASGKTAKASAPDAPHHHHGPSSWQLVEVITPAGAS